MPPPMVGTNCVCSFIQQVFIKHLLCPKHFSKHQGYIGEQKKAVVLNELRFHLGMGNGASDNGHKI